MRTITVQIPEDETKLFKELTKKLNWKVVSTSNIPNKETIEAIEEVKAGKGIKFKDVDELFAAIK